MVEEEVKALPNNYYPSFSDVGFFFRWATWENDLAKMMRVGRIHGIKECKNFMKKD